MGQNLALNIADHGFKISVYNRTLKTSKFLKANGNVRNLTGCEDIKEFVASLQKPRKIIIMVQAGKATDAVIDSLIPLLDHGDIIIDGGNAKWTDTIEREKKLNQKTYCLLDPVLAAEKKVRDLVHPLCLDAQLTPGMQSKIFGSPFPLKLILKMVSLLKGQLLKSCYRRSSLCFYIGSDGAGHYVKMVHNGIEYGDMQMICEAYHILSAIGSIEPQELVKF